MPEEVPQTPGPPLLQTGAYHVVRYQPNLIRDEWLNIGVLLYDPASGRIRQRWLEEPADLARLRRLHPAADETLLQALPPLFEGQLSASAFTPGVDAAALLEKFEQTLSNAVQLSPRKGVLSADLDAELERLFRDQVAPARESRRVAGEIRTRNDLRAQAADYFRSEKILRWMGRGVRVAEFTYPGDPMRMDFSYRRNGTRGFVQALALARDPNQAKVLAFTAESIRSKLDHSEFIAITEREPLPGNPRDQFVAGILKDKGVRMVPLAGLRKWAHDIAPVLKAVSSD